MKFFTGFIRRIEKHPRLKFVLTAAAFYLMLMTLYLYLMTANLSTAPEFVYSQF